MENLNKKFGMANLLTPLFRFFFTDMIRLALRDQLGNTVSDQVGRTHVQFNEKAQSGNMCKVNYTKRFSM